MERTIKLYHFFAWSSHYGWQHLGCADGYETVEELKEDMKFTISRRAKYKIMKLVAYNRVTGEKTK